MGQLDELAQSWEANAERWATAVRSGSIASRRLATDAAIIEAVAARMPRRVLDLGCGEGWLTRALTAQGVEAIGVDASPALIEAARAADPSSERYHVAGYAEAGTLPALAGDRFDVIAANFALLDEHLEAPLTSLRSLLAPAGALVIQTLHPFGAEPRYRDGWRVETFKGFGKDSGNDSGGAAAWQPMPWYFRTLGSWIALLHHAKYRLADLRETVHHETYHPLSMIVVAEPA
jgi:2-polyprenyl-3-methyl-5-hydroxy-6-metoxy-1,4-benzoquinol methylase